MGMEFALFANNETSIIATRINNKADFNRLDNALKDILSYLNPKHGLDLLPTEEVFVRGNVKYCTISSRTLFQNPEQFIKRFLTLLKTTFNLMEIPKNSRFTFSIEGIIDQRDGIILESDFLNSISLFSSYNGYRIKRELQKLVNAKEVRFLDPATAVVTGVVAEFKKLKKPSLFIVAGKNAELVYVNKKGEIRKLNLQNSPTPTLDGFSANYWLTNPGFDELIYSNVDDLASGYTKRLGDVLKFLREHIDCEKINLKSFFVYTPFEYLINKNQLKELLPSVVVYFPPDVFLLPIKVKKEWTHFSTLLLKLVQSFNLSPIDEGKYLIPIKGCLSTGKKPVASKQLKKIELWGKKTLLKKFINQKEFKNHWRMWRSTSNVDNIYRLIYKDGMTVSYKIGELKYESQIDSILKS